MLVALVPFDPRRCMTKPFHLPAVALALSLAVPGSAAAARWEKVGDTSFASVYVDRDSLQRNGNEVRAALEWRWRNPTEVPDTNGARTYRLERQVQLSNCTNRGYAVLEGTRYADERGIEPVSTYQHEERLLPWMEARPRTIRDIVIGHVCRAAPQRKKDPAPR
jgi:hypothetical protein